MTKGIARSRRCEASSGGCAAELRPTSMGGKICRSGINCRGGRAVRSTKNPYFIGFFRMARRLLINRCGNERPRYAAFVRSPVMLLALGAASSALDALKSLTSSKSSSSQSTGVTQDAANPFDLSGTTSASAAPPPPPFGSGGGSRVSPATMSALLAAQGESSTGSTTSASTSQSDALKDLFSQLDTDGDGQISKSELKTASAPRHQHRGGRRRVQQAGQEWRQFGQPRRNDIGAEGQGRSPPSSRRRVGRIERFQRHRIELRSAAAGVARCIQHIDHNSDGSTTTSMTYADGSKVTMTLPAATTASSTATSSYNFIEQMIQRQAQAVSTSANSSVSVSA